MKGIIVRISKLSENVVDMQVSVSLGGSAPGKFVHLSVPNHFLRRPISICGYANGIVRLVFAIRGSGTKVLAELKKGDEVDLLNALGNGFPGNTNGENQKTILVGGGLGVPPLLYYAKTYPNTFTIAGFRFREQAILISEFPNIEVCFGEDYPHLRLEETLKRERVSKVLACGPDSLLEATAGVCAKYGTPCFVSLEERMACGVGACLVCACAVSEGYLRCCKDGPVFDASLVYG